MSGEPVALEPSRVPPSVSRRSPERKQEKMLNLRSGAVIALLVPLLALSLVACSDDDTDAGDVSSAVTEVSGADSELCSSLTDLESAVSDAQSLDSSSTIDEADQASEDITNALEDVRDAASGVASAEIAAVETAYEAFSDEVASLSGEDTLGQAASQLSTEATAINEALEGLTARSGCS
jgi:hypothetical protein